MTKKNLRGLDVLTRKQLMLHHLFHIKGDVDCLYISRKMGGRCLLAVTETILDEERNSSAYVASLSERLLQLRSTSSYSTSVWLIWCRIQTASSIQSL